MNKRGSALILIAFFVLTALSCKNKEEVFPDTPLNPAFLRNGSVSLYHFKGKDGKVVRILKNHVLQDNVDEFLFLQEYSASNSEEILRVRLDFKTLIPNSIEIVKPEALDAKQSNQAQPSEKVLFKGIRSGTNFKTTNFNGSILKDTTFALGSFFMDQETMVFLLNCFPFESKAGDNIKFVNLRDQKEGIETIRIVGKETKVFNKTQVNAYKVELTSYGVTAWYMEEKPHMLIEANFPSGEKIILINWNDL